MEHIILNCNATKKIAAIIKRNLLYFSGDGIVGAQEWDGPSQSLPLPLRVAFLTRILFL